MGALTRKAARCSRTASWGIRRFGVAGGTLQTSAGVQPGAAALQWRSERDSGISARGLTRGWRHGAVEEEPPIVRLRYGLPVDDEKPSIAPGDSQGAAGRSEGRALVCWRDGGRCSAMAPLPPTAGRRCAASARALFAQQDHEHRAETVRRCGNWEGRGLSRSDHLHAYRLGEHCADAQIAGRLYCW